MVIFSIILEKVSQAFEIITPIVLFLWFLHIRKKVFNEELVGVYGGFVNKEHNDPHSSILAGVIFYIRDMLNSGFFRGEFDYRENLNTAYDKRTIHDGNYIFYGKIKYKWWYFPKYRNALIPKENRKYFGSLTIVSRLDFDFQNQTIDEFSYEEYRFVYYREMRTFVFTQSKKGKTASNNLPETFTLYKSFGLSFEPHRNISEVLFGRRIDTD